METSKFHRVGPGGPYEYCHEKLIKKFMNFHGNFMGEKSSSVYISSTCKSLPMTPASDLGLLAPRLCASLGSSYSHLKTRGKATDNNVMHSSEYLQ